MRINFFKFDFVILKDQQEKQSCIHILLLLSLVLLLVSLLIKLDVKGILLLLAWLYSLLPILLSWFSLNAKAKLLLILFQGLLGDSFCLALAIASMLTVLYLQFRLLSGRRWQGLLSGLCRWFKVLYFHFSLLSQLY